MWDNINLKKIKEKIIDHLLKLVSMKFNLIIKFQRNIILIRAKFKYPILCTSGLYL